MISLSLCRRLLFVCAALLLAPPVWAQPVASTTASNVPPPGMARIWWYRALEPYSSLATPYVRMNGAIAGVSQPGDAFYNDRSEERRVGIECRQVVDGIMNR